MNRIAGKRVLITGASAGIGAACARAFAERGANLVLWARRDDRLREIASTLTKTHDIDVVCAQVDVRDRGAVHAEVQSMEGAPDVLVNNAGLAAGLNKLHEGSFEDWDRMIDTNVKGLLNVTREILPPMVERDAGHIINIGSIAGHWAYPMGNVYNATKFAVRALTEAIGIDLAGTRIRISSVDPGATDTEFSLVRFHGDVERARHVYDGFEPLAAEDVADAVCYVANTPEHVNVFDLVIMPTAQRNPYVVAKKQ